jgi:P-type conjugative transfer ATPase TrbB
MQAIQSLTPRAEQDKRLSDTLQRQLGPMVCGLLAADDVVEIMLNPDGTIWVDRLGKGMERVAEMADSVAESFIGTVASTLRTTVTRENPILECELPLVEPFNGARFEAIIPPVVMPGPAFTIRCKAAKVFSLEDYVNHGIMTAAQRETIEQAVADRMNIKVVGGTGTGKTTLLNAIVACIADSAPDHRLVLLEDTREIQCTAENIVPLRTTETTDMTKLLKATMRLRPDRIIVGEVRGGEALALLKAWNTGHPGGASTIHANTHENAARAALIRLEQLIQEVSTAPMRDLIAEAVNLIVSIGKIAEAPGRKILEIVKVKGFENGTYKLEPAE